MAKGGDAYPVTEADRRLCIFHASRLHVHHLGSWRSMRQLADTVPTSPSWGVGRCLASCDARHLSAPRHLSCLRLPLAANASSFWDLPRPRCLEWRESMQQNLNSASLATLCSRARAASPSGKVWIRSGTLHSGSPPQGRWILDQTSSCCPSCSGSCMSSRAVTSVAPLQPPYSRTRPAGRVLLDPFSCSHPPSCLPAQPEFKRYFPPATWQSTSYSSQDTPFHHPQLHLTWPIGWLLGRQPGGQVGCHRGGRAGGRGAAALCGRPGMGLGLGMQLSFGRDCRLLRSSVSMCHKHPGLRSSHVTTCTSALAAFFSPEPEPPPFSPDACSNPST